MPIHVKQLFQTANNFFISQNCIRKYIFNKMGRLFILSEGQLTWYETSLPMTSFPGLKTSHGLHDLQICVVFSDHRRNMDKSTFSTDLKSALRKKDIILKRLFLLRNSNKVVLFKNGCRRSPCRNDYLLLTAFNADIDV